MHTGRPLLSVTIAAVAGVIAMIVTNQAGNGGDLLSLTEYLAPKGVMYGSIIAIAVFVSTRLLSTSLKARSWGLLAATIVTGFFGLLVLSWNLMWRTPLSSLEGAWLWPLAIVLLVLSLVSFRHWRRARRADDQFVGR